jgi:hypothetical protein
LLQKTRRFAPVIRVRIDRRLSPFGRRARRLPEGSTTLVAPKPGRCDRILARQSEQGGSKSADIDAALKMDLRLTDEPGMSNSAHAIVPDQHEPVRGVEVAFVTGAHRRLV